MKRYITVVDRQAGHEVSKTEITGMKHDEISRIRDKLKGRYSYRLYTIKTDPAS